MTPRSISFVPDGYPLRTLWGHTGTGNGVGNAALFPNGQLLAPGTEAGVYLWHTADSHPLSILRGGHRSGAFRVAFSPGGQILATAGGIRVHLWRAAQEEEQ